MIELESTRDDVMAAATLWHGKDAGIARDWLAMRDEIDRLRGREVHDDDDGETD